MKKVMFVFVMLLVASTCFAQLQSGPSNTVGYVKIIAVGGAGTVATPFGLPFKFWDVPVGGIPTYGVVSNNPSDIAGDQTNCGTTVTADRVTRQENGNFALRNSASACAWTGLLETSSGMVPGRAFWYLNKTGANRNFVLAGEVDNSGNYLTVSVTGGGASTPYGWRDSRSLNRDDLNLIASGFIGGGLTTSDRVTAQQGGAFFWRRSSDNTWQGTLVTVEPGAAYWIKNNHGAAFNYNYDASGNTLSVGIDPARRDDNGGSVSKVITTPKTKASSGTVRE